MGLSDEQIAAMKAELRGQLEALAGEPVLGFGFFGYVGFIEEIGGKSQISRDAGAAARMSSWFKGKKQAGGLPTQVLLTLTPTRALAVTYQARASGVVPDRVSRSWDRATTRIQVEDKPGSDRSRATVTLAGADGEETVRLDSYDMGFDINDEVIALLRN